MALSPYCFQGIRVVTLNLTRESLPSAQVENFLQTKHAFVRPSAVQRLEERRHLALPALVHVPHGHRSKCFREIARLQIPD